MPSFDEDECFCHYLFDKYINKDIGNTIPNVEYIRKYLGLDAIFTISNDNLFNVPVPEHATLFYKITNGDKYYIYYSNSGFGGENHIIIDNKSIVPKLYKVDTEKLQTDIIMYIIFFIEKLTTINIYSFIINRIFYIY